MKRFFACLGVLVFLLFIPSCQDGPTRPDEPLVPMMDVVVYDAPGGGEGFVAPSDVGSPVAATQAVIQSTSPVGKILLVTFATWNPADPHNQNLYENLHTHLGYDVHHLYNPSSGDIAQELADFEFQQVWLWDLTQESVISSGDVAAIAAWYTANAKGNIVVDARSYGTHGMPSGDLPLTQNYAHAFGNRCGGLWIGTDDEGPAITPDTWTYNGNAVLSALGYGTVTGELAHVYDLATDLPGHELLNFPNILSLDPYSIRAWNTPGIAPTGPQPDGTTLTKLLYPEDPGFAPDPLVSFSLAQDYCTIWVDIDIKPGSYPNCFKLGKKGVTPVAILGSDVYDIFQIDPETIRLGDGSGEVAPLRWASNRDVNDDGLLDLVFHFSSGEMEVAFSWDEDEKPLFLTGQLKEEFNGTPIFGEDVVHLTTGEICM